MVPSVAELEGSTGSEAIMQSTPRRKYYDHSAGSVVSSTRPSTSKILKEGLRVLQFYCRGQRSVLHVAKWLIHPFYILFHVLFLHFKRYPAECPQHIPADAGRLCSLVPRLSSRAVDPLPEKWAGLYCAPCAQ